MKRIGYILMMCTGILCISAVKAHTYTFLNYTDKNVKIRWILSGIAEPFETIDLPPKSRSARTITGLRAGLCVLQDMVSLSIDDGKTFVNKPLMGIFYYNLRKIPSNKHLVAEKMDLAFRVLCGDATFSIQDENGKLVVYGRDIRDMVKRPDKWGIEQSAIDQSDLVKQWKFDLKN